jgi:hypothetical protein
MCEEISKKFGGQSRASKARRSMSRIFKNENHPLYLEKDIDLARKYDVSRLTIYNIREQLGIPPRTERILARLAKIKTKDYTKKELADLLHMKYQNLYKILREYKIEVKPDTPPIQSMIRFQKRKKVSIKKTSEKEEAPKESSSRSSKKTTTKKKN